VALGNNYDYVVASGDQFLFERGRLMPGGLHNR
jgi:hypothetical protein